PIRSQLANSQSKSAYIAFLGLRLASKGEGGIMTLKSYIRSIDGFVHRCAICSKRVSIRE
ncbi:unnamed protein product, partial [Trichobilharzia szidati]